MYVTGVNYFRISESLANGFSITPCDRQTQEKQIRASGRRNETRINILITDSWDFPGRLIARAYIFVRSALSSAGLIKILYQATSLLRLLDRRSKKTASHGVYLARNINYLIGVALPSPSTPFNFE